jgi:hypothetical protein
MMTVACCCRWRYPMRHRQCKQILMRDNLKGVWAKFLLLKLEQSMEQQMPMHKVQNSAQVSSCQIKFVQKII